MKEARTNGFYQMLARFLDGLVLRSHARVTRRHEKHLIQPRLMSFSENQDGTFSDVFPAPPPLALDYIRGDAWERQVGFWRRDFTFPACIPATQKNNTHAIVQTYAPERVLHLPAVIVLHGLMTLTLLPYRPFFRAIADAGASAYAVELPYHLRRTPPGSFSGELFFTADFEMSLATIQQTVAEIRQLIHYLREAGAPTIGLLGFSLGAWMSALVASCEPEVDFALLAMPPSNLNAVFWQTKLGEPLRRQFETAGWSAADTASFYQRLDPQHLSLLIPPERCAMFAAKFDHFIPFAYTQQLQRQWQHSDLHVYSAGHIGMIWSRKFLRDIRFAVAQQLRLGRRRETPVTVVTEETIQALPINTPQSSAAPEALPQFVSGK